jgi:alpha-beta hydrolase superfamily lysophospholipase
MKARFAGLAGLLVLLLGCVAHVNEKTLVHPRPGIKLADGNSGDGQWQIRSADIARPDGVTLYSALFSRPDATALVIYFGGNGFVIGDGYQHVLNIYKNQPVDVLIVDHRGYGASTGSASINGMLSDAVPVYDYARALPAYRNKPIIVHGHSLGSFMAGEIARQRKLDGLVLESSATTAEDWVQEFADTYALVRSGVVDGDLKGKGNLSVMATLDEPVLIVVGEKDKTTGSEMSSKLFAAANVPADQEELLIVPKAGHIDAALSEAYGQAFSRLLARSGRK